MTVIREYEAPADSVRAGVIGQALFVLSEAILMGTYETGRCLAYAPRPCFTGASPEGAA